MKTSITDLFYYLWYICFPYFTRSNLGCRAPEQVQETGGSNEVSCTTCLYQSSRRCAPCANSSSIWRWECVSRLPETGFRSWRQVYYNMIHMESKVQNFDLPKFKTLLSVRRLSHSKPRSSSTTNSLQWRTRNYRRVKQRNNVKRTLFVDSKSQQSASSSLEVDVLVDSLRGRSLLTVWKGRSLLTPLEDALCWQVT
jgi:hypothetical protein